MKNMNNIYKPRYKVAFQTKSKVWAYKNSRLRHFYSIRGRRLYRMGFFRKNIIVSNTLKWTIARRFIKPYSRRVKSGRAQARYKNTFYLKQQLRHFYGKITETAFRNIYKTHLISTVDRNKSFFGSLEQRADMFFFRMRLLPTIYACNQFIYYQGLLINYKRLEKCPATLIKIGSIVSLPKRYWRILAKYMIYRVYYRVYGKLRLKKRIRKLLKKKISWLRSNRWKKKRKYINAWWYRLKILNLLVTFRKILIILTQNLYGETQGYPTLHASPVELSSLLNNKFLEKYAHLPIVSKLSHEFFKYQRKLVNTVYSFILNYKIIWKNVARYDSNLSSTNKWKKKKIFKTNLRLFILISLQNFNHTSKLRNIIDYFRNRVILLKTFFDLEELKKGKSSNYFYKDLITVFNVNIKNVSKNKIVYMSDLLKYLKVNNSTELYKEYLVKKYNINVKNVFQQKEISLEALIPYIQDKLTKKLQYYVNWTSTYTVVVHKNYNLQQQLYLQSKIKKFTAQYKAKTIIEKNKKKLIIRPSALTYLLVNHLYKKRRKRQIYRLKKVHWYIPKYIHFDVRTLRGTLLYVPRATEIVHPFKCSLFKIFSFYKSLGV